MTPFPMHQPVTPVDLVAAGDLERHLSLLPYRGSVAVWSRARPLTSVAHWSAAPSQAAGFESALYDTLRRLDALGAVRIVIESPPGGPAWVAVHDRLARAAHR